MSLRKQTIKGLAWSFGARFFRIGFQFLITAVLARLLSPNDFGVMGMATVFIGFATLFNEMGVGSALIQKQDVEEKHFSSVFWLNILVGIGLALIFIALSPLIAAFYEEPELKLIIIVSTLNFVFLSFSIVPMSLFQRNMDFKKISLVESIATLFSGIGGVALAYNGFGVWSLIGQSMIYTSAYSLLLFAIVSWRPKAIFSFSAIKDLFAFSSNLTLFNMLNYFGRNIDYLLIGKFLGAEALGFYTLAYKLMLIPLRHISSVITKVVFPAFSRIQHDIVKIRLNYLKMVKAIALVTFPMMIILFVMAEDFVLFVYGEKWKPVVLLIQILCFCGMFQSIGTTVGNIRVSQGKTGLHLLVGIINTVLVTLVVAVSLRWGIYVVAASYTVLYFFWYNFTGYMSFHLIDLSMWEFTKKLSFPYIASACVLLAGLGLQHYTQHFIIEFRILLVGCMSVVFYGFILLATGTISFKKKRIALNL